MNISELNDWLVSENQQPLIMGVLNVTPDSFTDGGKFLNPTTAVNHALGMINNGADMIDIGGESTRPFSNPVSDKEELSRVISVVKSLREKTDTVISIDTTKSQVAEKSCENGANLINDISGFLFDDNMVNVAKKYNCPIILMHISGNPKTMQENPVYENVVEDIKNHLLERVAFAQQNGIQKNKIILDPGIGFGKTIEDNLIILNKFEKFSNLSYPILVGTSRKSFIGNTLNVDENNRIEGTIASNVIALSKGCKIFRVHDIKESKRALTLANKIFNSKSINT